jgi:hypothetical protein
MLRKEKITLPALLLALAAACARAPAWEWKTPPVLDEKALLAELRARGTEKGVLVNFWATW